MKLERSPWQIAAALACAHLLACAASGTRSGLAIDPPEADLAPDASTRFVATVDGASTPVAWTVAEPEGGTIDGSGVYVAPATEGTYHVVAVAAGVQTVAKITVKRHVRVSVSPSAATISEGATLQLTASVAGTGNTAVTWAVQEGSAGGTVDASGLYTAPAAAGIFHVVATSDADPTKTATSTVTVTAPVDPVPTPAPSPAVAVSVAPASATLLTGGTAQLAATVTGATDTTVTWSVQEGAGGTVSAAGLYTAPATAGTYHVVATSNADPTKSATATMTVNAPPVGVSVAPTSATVVAGGTVQLTATVTGTTDTTVTWSVQEGAAGGSVNATGLYTAPSTAGTYHVVARSHADPTVAATSTVTVTAAATGPTVWNVTVSPPALSNPETITLPGNYLSTISHTLCTGPGYVVNLDNTKDYIIRTNAVLHAPVAINGGRNVRIIGIDIDLDTAACATSGASGYVPGTIALRTNQIGTTFIEGAYIDVRRRSTDCIVARNGIGGGEALSKGYTEAAARGARDVIVQNSICRGMSGDSNIHGDVLQTQGLHELYRTIVFENVSVDSNCEGTVILQRDGYTAANSMTLRRFDYRMDPRYTPNPKTGGGYWTGGPVMHSAKTYSYANAYLDLDIVRQYDASGSVTSPPCNGSTGVFCPVEPSGADRYASPGTGAVSDAWTGLNYVSPHP